MSEWKFDTDPTIKEGASGYIYKACYGDNCSFILKCTDEPPDREIYFQEKAAEGGCSIKVIEIVEYHGRKGWIMERLDISLYDILFDLYPENIEYIKDYFEKTVSLFMSGVSELTKEEIKQIADQRFNSIEEMNAKILEIRKIWKKETKLARNPLGYSPLKIEDSEDLKKLKKNELMKALDLDLAIRIDALHIVHNDLRSTNIMRKSDGNYYAIDFGLSYECEKTNKNVSQLYQFL